MAPINSPVPGGQAGALRRAFTLMEILVVLAIIGVLMTISFAAFGQVRRSARQTACLSNIRQLGAATLLYAQDNSDLLPWGADPIDLHTNCWHNTKYASAVKSMRPLPVVLQPYTTSAQLWRCPSDTGSYTGEPVLSAGLMVAKPTSFEAFGSSYFYHTGLVFALRPLSSLTAYNTFNHDTKFGPSQILLLFDGYGAWHGGSAPADYRYNALFADGHASVENALAMNVYSLEKLDNP